MTAQDVILGSRVAHVRELKTEVARLKAANVALTEELAAFNARFDQALLAALELRDGGELEIWDGWNLILSSERVAKDRRELIAQAQATGRKVWIVFDGPDENVSTEGDVRISYTGGHGEHRADRFVCDFLRTVKCLGLSAQVKVRTFDADFRKEVIRLGAFLV